jgi:hypothetical protein
MGQRLAAEGLDSHAKIGSPHQPAIILSPVVARSFASLFRRLLMGDKSPKNVNKQKKVQDQKKQNNKKQPAAPKK